MTCDYLSTCWTGCTHTCIYVKEHTCVCTLVRKRKSSLRMRWWAREKRGWSARQDSKYIVHLVRQPLFSRVNRRMHEELFLIEVHMHVCSFLRVHAHASAQVRPRQARIHTTHSSGCAPGECLCTAECVQLPAGACTSIRQSLAGVLHGSPVSQQDTQAGSARARNGKANLGSQCVSLMALRARTRLGRAHTLFSL